MCSNYVNGYVLDKLNIVEKLMDNIADDDCAHEILDLIIAHKKDNCQEPLAKKLLQLLLHQTQYQYLDAMYQQLHSDIINMTHDHITIMDEDSKILCVNQEFAKITGFKTPENAHGLSYADFKGDAADFADIFMAQDKQVITTGIPVTYLSYHQYAEGQWRLLQGEKNTILDKEQNKVGIFNRSTDITTHKLIDVSRFLIQEQTKYYGKLHQKAFTYYIFKDESELPLSKKEQEVLFYFIRGKTAQEIADIMHRSKRTIEMHIESIKEKLEVPNKSELIEKSIVQGYMNYIPETLLK